MKEFTRKLCTLLVISLTMAFLLCGCTSSNDDQPNVIETTTPPVDPELAWFYENVPEPEVTAEIVALKQEISTVEEAMDYLSGRYSHIGLGTGWEADSVVMYFSAQENLQPYQDVIRAGDVAPIITYLLEDDLDVFTLLACDYRLFPYTVLCVQYDDHIEILDPVDQMPADWDDFRMLTGSFDSLESYADALFSYEMVSASICGLYRLPDTGRYFFRVEENNTATLLVDDAFLIRDNREVMEYLRKYHMEEVEKSIPYFVPQARLRSQISTVEDAVTYLEEKHGTVWSFSLPTMEDYYEGYWWLFSGEEVIQLPPHNNISRDNVVQVVTYLLSDDMEIYSVIGFAHDERGVIAPKSINCIKTDSGYQFIDPVRLMRDEPFSRYGTTMPEATVGSLEEYVEMCKAIPGLSLYVDCLYLFSGSEKIEAVLNSRGIAEMIPRENCQLLWDNTAKNDLTQDQYLQLLASYIDPQYISNYDLYGCLGGATLTPEEARALVDAKPETVKEQVKTAADMLMYMLAANIQPSEGCYHDNWDGDVWHTNMNARQVMQTKLAVCGSCANLANYLLEDDYEEVGFIDHALYPGQGGSHVYNYILYEGKYYIVDFSHYMDYNYVGNMTYPLLVVDSLEAWGDAIRAGAYSLFYNKVCLITAYTSTGQQLPCIFEYEHFRDTGEAYYYFPEGAEYTLIYDAGDGFQMAEKPFNKAYYDWTVFWGDTDREPQKPSPTHKNISAAKEQTTVSAGYAKPENIAQYDLYNHLGGTTLTPDEARSLANAQPEAVKEKVKTAADLLMYMLAANIRECNGCYCDNWDGDTWHTNMNARQVMQTKLGNCGSCANLANYLLEGDYEEVGYIDHAFFPGKGGSHIYNYIFHEGKYYVVDFSSYMFSKYDPSRDYSVSVMDSLSEWSHLIEGYYSDVNIIVSYTSTGQQLPCIFSRDNYQSTGEAYYYFPEGAEYTVIYEADSGFQLAQKPFNKTYYDWTVFWGETDRAPKNPA